MITPEVLAPQPPTESTDAPSSSDAPCVSLGLPVRNGERFLEETLRSILSQTFTDFELVISDNGSTDRTQAICERYAAADARIRYHRLDTNLGAAPNYNRVFALARGRYFKWAAHDDLLHPTFLERCVEVMERSPGAAVVYTRTELIDDRGNLSGTDDLSLAEASSSVTASLRLRHFYRNIRLANPIFGLMRTDALRKTRLIDSFCNSDLILLAELLMLGRFEEHPELLFQRRLHEGRSVRAHPSEKERQVWFDTARPIRFPWIPLRIRMSWEYTRSVWRMPIPARDRMGCMLVSLRWQWWPELVKIVRRQLARLRPPSRSHDNAARAS